METLKNDYIYRRISANLEQKILSGVLKAGDKLPSVRAISGENGVSISTVLQAYYTLEGKGLIESRPQSGYYVVHCAVSLPALVSSTRPDKQSDPLETENLITKVYSEIGHDRTLQLSLGVPQSELIPVAKLSKALVHATRTLSAAGVTYEPVQGNLRLRRQVARYSYTWGGNLNEDDIITSAGGMSALTYCIMSLASKGDTIAVESPVYFGILQLARSLGLNVLELPTNAQTGIEPEALEQHLKADRIKLCLLISNFSNPIGSCMPDEHKRFVVELMEHYGVPLIEDDIYGDVYFGRQRPSSLKSFDRSGNVLWCGGVSKTLAPGYRVGWVAPGKYADKVLKAKLYQNISGTAITQEAIGLFLENGRYENHLRKLRHTLHGNSLSFIRSIGEFFPDGTKVTRPQGSFMLWLELPKSVNTIELYEKALASGISIAPGRMFTLQDQYYNCIRLSYGMIWNERVENGVKMLGKIAGNLT